MTGRKAVVLGAAAMLLIPAGADARTGSIYDVTFAKGFEKLSFTGDADSNCAQFAVCGVDGTTTYTLAGKPKGKLFVTRGRRGKVDGLARYTGGETQSSVSNPDTGVPCDDLVRHTTDLFELSSSGSKFQSVLLSYHTGTRTDYLKTACAGPTEADVRAADALPEGLFRAKDFFRGRKPRLTLSGASPFRAGGFNATVEWDLTFKARQRACSPRCKLPAGTP